MIVKGFSENLQYFRKLAQKNQEKMAEELGISYSYYTKIESTDEVPSVEILMAIGKYFNIPVDFLLKDSGYRNHAEYANLHILSEMRKLSDESMKALTDALTFLYVNCIGEAARESVVPEEPNKTTRNSP